jgi:hypothetical protein
LQDDVTEDGVDRRPDAAAGAQTSLGGRQADRVRRAPPGSVPRRARRASRQRNQGQGSPGSISDFFFWEMETEAEGC